MIRIRRILILYACMVGLATAHIARAQTGGAYAKASGKCSTAINTGDFANISIHCTYSELPAEWRAKVDQLAKQVAALTRQASVIKASVSDISKRVDRIELASANQQQAIEARLNALEGGLSAATAENDELRNQLSAVYAKFRISAEEPGASAQVKSALSALDRGDAAPAAQLLAKEAGSSALTDQSRASSLLAQQAVLLQTKDLGAALTAAKESLKLDPTNDTARSLAVGLSTSLGDFEGAVELQRGNVESARAALTANPKDALLEFGLAASLVQLGNLHLLRGQYTDAETATSEAITLLRALVGGEPDNVAWSDLLAGALSQASSMLQATDRLAEALKAQQEALKLSEAMEGRFSSPATKFSLISRLQGQGMLELRVGRSTEARQSFERALKEIGLLISAYPQIEAGYATQAALLGLLSSIDHSSGLFEDAIAKLNKAIAIVQQRRKAHPEDTFWPRQTEILLGALGDAQVSRAPSNNEEFVKFTGEALGSYEQANDIAAQLAKSRPNEPVYAQDRWLALSRLARVRMARGEFNKAGDLLESGIKVLDPLVAKFGDLSYWHALYGQGQWQLAMVRFSQGRLDDAAPIMRHSVDELERATTADPDNTTYRHDLAVALFSQADLSAKRGDSASAIADLERAANIRTALNAQDRRNGLWSWELILTFGAIAQSPEIDATKAIETLKKAKALADVHEANALQPALPAGTPSSIQALIDAKAPTK